MPIGTTIDGLNAVTSLTANDEVAVWDKEASDEPTKKITGQNLASSVKTLANLQGALTFDTTPTDGSTNPVTSGGIATAITQSTAISAITFTPASGITNNLFVRKSGKVVSINGYLTATNAFPSSEYTLGNLPAGARPTAPIRCLAGVAEAAYTPRDTAYLLVSSAGDINITAKAGNTYKVCYFNVTYIAEA